MRKRSPIYSFILTALTFIILEGLAVLMVLNNGVIGKYKVMSVISDIKFSALELGSNVRSNFKLKDNNAKLQNENSQLLSSLYGRIDDKVIPVMDTVYCDSSNFTFVPANIIFNSLNKMNNYIILDKGIKDSIDIDMGVITTKGVIGYVESVSENYCKVKSLLSLDNKIGGIIKSNGTYGSIKWDGESSKYVNMINIPLHTTFSPGDTITTSGFSLIYPKSIPIGKIKTHKLNRGTDHELQVELFEDFHSLSYAYIVKNNNIDEIKSLLNKEGQNNE